MSRLEVILRGKIDGGKRQIRFKFSAQDCVIDIFLLFLNIRHQPESSVSIIVKTSVNDQYVPVDFPTGTRRLYCLEVFGLRSKDSIQYEHVAFVRKEFMVMKGRQDKEIGITLSRAILPAPPLLFSFLDKLDIEIEHTPTSTYTLKGTQASEKETVWIIFLKEATINFFIVSSKNLEYKLPFDLPPAKIHRIKVVSGFILHENHSLKIVGNERNTEITTFKSCFTRVEYKKLLKKTTNFTESLNGKFCVIEYLYRNKSAMYFASIKEYHNGVMKPYRKDNNGDPCSVINGRIDGLFFSTAVAFDTMLPFSSSLYGPVRLHIEANVLFTPNHNLYFADFYCHYNVHYVTVVLTPKWSPTDEFCRDRL